MTQKTPSNWQQAITGEWHGYPSVFAPDGACVGTNKVSRASEFKDGRTTYWMHTAIDAAGPIGARFDMGDTGMRFGVIDSDADRIYCGPDFYGAGRPFGMLVDSNYYSPGWSADLRTVNLVLPDRKLQVYSSLLYEGPTLIATFNGLYTVTQDHGTNPETQAFVARFLEREKALGKRQFIAPVKQGGEWRGTVQVFDPDQAFVGEAVVKIVHTPLTLLRARTDVSVSGAIDRKFSYEQQRSQNHHTFDGPDVFGNAISYGRYLYGVRHFVGEAFKLRSRETMLFDDDGALVVVWNFYKSDKEHLVAFGVLDWHPGAEVISERHIG